MALNNKLCRMHRKVTVGVFKVVLCLVFIMATIQLYSTSPDNNRKFDLNSAIEAVTKQIKNFPPSTKFVIYEIPMEKDSIIEPAFNSDKNKIIRCTERSWVFVADFYPGATFEHQIKIGIINESNRDNPKIIDAQWWPIKTVNNKTEQLYLSSDKWGKINREVKETVKETLNPNCVTDSLHQEKNIFPEIAIIGSPTASRKLWAIIICGYSEDTKNYTFSYDANDMYSTLNHIGVPENQIFYITPNKLHLENDSKIFCTEASICSIKTCFEVIKEKIQRDEKFLFFISTHGGYENLTLENSSQEEETLTAQLLNIFLNKIQCKTQFIVINACRSGSFICPLIETSIIATNRVVITSCNSNELSCKDLDNINCDPNFSDRGSEFLSGFIESFSKTEADKDNDDKISIQEAFLYAKECAWCANNSSTINARYEPKYHPQLAYSCGIDPYTEFLFWN